VPCVEGRIGELPAAFDIDTGSRSELDITSPTVARYGLRARFPHGAEAVTGWGVGGPSRSYVVRLPSITLGTQQVAPLIAGLSLDRGGSFSDPNYQGNIGSALLQRFVVTFDYEHQSMYVARIEPAPQDIADFDRSGLWINAARGGYEVKYVTAHSAAAECGIMPGDLIVQLDGRTAAADALSDARRLLRTRAAGSVVPLIVQRGGAERHVTLVLRDQI